MFFVLVDCKTAKTIFSNTFILKFELLYLPELEMRVNMT